jgi:hypothetical protein
LRELDQEMADSRKSLERTPDAKFKKFNWKLRADVETVILV